MLFTLAGGFGLLNTLGRNKLSNDLMDLSFDNTLCVLETSSSNVWKMKESI